MGEMLAAVDLQHGARDGKKKNGVDRHDPVLTLLLIGITKDESSQAQYLASLPAETFEAVKSFTEHFGSCSYFFTND